MKEKDEFYWITETGLSVLERTVQVEGGISANGAGCGSLIKVSFMTMRR